MSFSAKNYDFKGETCIELIAGDFRALIAPFNGSNVMKLENTALDIDILRNVLYSGVWYRYEQVREKREKEKEEKNV